MLFQEAGETSLCACWHCKDGSVEIVLLPHNDDMTYIVDSSQCVTVFSMLAVCDTIAEPISGLLTARLLDISTRLERAFDGVCFLITPVCRHY